MANIIGIDRAFEAMLPLQMSKDRAYIILTRDIFRTVPTITNITAFIHYGITVPIIMLLISGIIYFVVEGVSKKERRGKVLILVLLVLLICIYTRLSSDNNSLFIVWLLEKLIIESPNIYFGINIWAIVTQNQELYRDIQFNKPEYILILKEKQGAGFEMFEFTRYYPDIFRYIKNHYKVVKVIMNKERHNNDVRIDIYQYKGKIERKG